MNDPSRILLFGGRLVGEEAPLFLLKIAGRSGVIRVYTLLDRTHTDQTTMAHRVFLSRIALDPRSGHVLPRCA